MLVPDTRLLVPLGDLDPRDAAPLSDAALTPYHALKLALAKLVPGTSVLVIGVGGLGHMAVQLVRAMTPADVIAVDVDPGKLELAREVGATATVEAGEGAAEAVRELTGGRGVTVVLDCVGTDATLALDAATVSSGGSVMVIGVAGGTLPLTFSALPFDASITHPYWGSAIELAEVLELARAGPHPRPRRALPPRPGARGLPADARRVAQRAGGDHAQRLRSAAGGAVLRPRRRPLRCAGA